MVIVCLGVAMASVSQSLLLSSSSSAQEPRYIILRFDDGYENQFQYAKPILDEFGLKAVFAIPTAAIYGENISTESGRTNPDMSWDQVRALYADGMEIASHTEHHVHLNEVNSTALVNEINGSRNEIAANGIPAPSTFVYPYGEGWNNSTVVHEIFASGYVVALGVGGFWFNIKTVNTANVEGVGVIQAGRGSLAWFATAANRAQGDIAVMFIFHGVGDHVRGVGNYLYINESNFVADMQYLKQNGFTVVTPSQLWPPHGSSAGPTTSGPHVTPSTSSVTGGAGNNPVNHGGTIGLTTINTFEIITGVAFLIGIGAVAMIRALRRGHSGPL
jgi:hypothetical protein